ncbi:MAG TPA: helix-turn-helix transcriptional regulator [Chthoniobacteraceae bacterium]|nr:helix-turn-helix transcriptional regulator [Chthoniobacteraceae bacterium]
MIQKAAFTPAPAKPPSSGGSTPFRFDPRRGDASFTLDDLDGAAAFAEPGRWNYFTILFIREGRGWLAAEALRHRYDGPALLFFNPYQTFHLIREAPHAGTAIRFHANFFCLEAHHEAVGCNGVLFNDIYGLPLVKLPGDADVAEVAGLLESMAREREGGGLASPELLISYLKVLLIKATRLKLDQQGEGIWFPGHGEAHPSVARRFQHLVEEHYRALHRPHAYAALLEITPKRLGKLVKEHFHKTPTELIRERLLKEGKWQLLHTHRPVREIAASLGFDDEFYFSRLFRRAVGASPSAFREYERLIRPGGNASM